MDKRLRFIVNILYMLILIGLFYLALKYALGIVLPFVLAFVIAWALQRPIKLLCGRVPKLSHGLSAVIVITVFLATVGTTAALLAGALIREIADFAADIPVIVQELIDRLTDSSGRAQWMSSLPGWIREPLTRWLERLDADLPGMIWSAVEGLTGTLLGSVGAIGAFAMRVPTAVLSVFITVIAIYFIGMDFGGVLSMLRSLCPPAIRSKLGNVRRCSVSTVTQLLRTYAFLMLLTFTELAVGFALINLLGQQIAYVVPLALIIALVDILPVLGVGTVLLPWALVDMMTGMSARGIMLAVLYAIIVVVRNFLEPKLVGERFGLHPAATLLALYVGGKLFGFVGVFALPLTLIVLHRLYDSGAVSLPWQSE
ncbi:MAG: sporulation integral membrane protein YtvI [Clostridia bacterium]|nr:sporulation integral membrane protein YtvI [Clostridia bacterium]